MIFARSRLFSARFCFCSLFDRISPNFYRSACFSSSFVSRPPSPEKKKPKNIPTKVGAKNVWLDRQLKDPFVRQRRIDNYRARSAYKLLEIDDRFRLLKRGMVLVELGAAPGSWTQVLLEKTSSDDENQGKIIAVDLLPIAPLDGAFLLDNCDFTADETKEKIMQILGVQQKDSNQADYRENGVGLLDGVLSDMAPNAAGTHQINHERIIHLAYGALAFAAKFLKPEQQTFFLCKLWDGSERSKYFVDVKKFFRKVTFVKPESSRDESSEIYILARHFKGLEKR